jgi:TonB family protein
LADVRLIVDGFLELAHAKPATPEPSSPPAPVVASSTDNAVVPPTPIFQPQPNVPAALFNLVRQLRRPGKIDVVINEQGTVDDVTVTQPVSPAYDKLVVAAARTWRYKPALKNGVPTRFVSTVVINVSEE